MMFFLQFKLFSKKRFLLCFYLSVILHFGTFAGFSEKRVLKFIAAKKVASVSIISGKVVDSNGEALPGVSVSIKNTKIFTVTNEKGLYKISIPENIKSPVLTFTFIGFSKKEVEVMEQTVVNITLIEDSNVLNEIMVVGYGSVNKRDLISSVGTAKMEDIEKAPVQ